MAARGSRHLRRLVIFVIAVIALYGGVALTGDWAPKLGLDLKGGTRITLTAETEDGGDPSQAAMKQANAIIDDRVNGSGVSESEVSTQGKSNIVVEIPGKNRRDLVEAVSQTAQLRFRLVANACGGPCIAGSAPITTPSASPSASPSTSPSASPTAKATTGKGGKSGNGRAVSGGLLAVDQLGRPGLAKTPTPRATPLAKPTPSPAPSPTGGSASPTPSDDGAPVGDQLAWQDDPGSKWLSEFSQFTCPATGAPEVKDDPDQPLVTCNEDGNKLLLSSAVIEGTQLKTASSGPTPQGIGYEVRLKFDGSATETFRKISIALYQVGKQFAIVLDGVVISNAGFNEPIPNGEASITGSFTQREAASLATSLKYGALPLKFVVSEVSEEGPTLAADQLSAGLLAGGAGLALVLVYCLLYYRGLGLVVMASLFAAAGVTYAVVLLMSKAAGFTLTLPGIAGLIVAVGITADSFIVYFERIRDEMREGKSMRVAVEAGWVRARNTCLAADSVSLLAAVVLYVFAIGVVKGFAFALGISTVIDLAIFFLFTKPMVSYLATFRFFNTGHKWSGLSADHIGIERIGSARPAGGTA